MEGFQVRNRHLSRLRRAIERLVCCGLCWQLWTIGLSSEFWRRWWSPWLHGRSCWGWRLVQAVLVQQGGFLEVVVVLPTSFSGLWREEPPSRLPVAGVGSCNEVLRIRNLLTRSSWSLCFLLLKRNCVNNSSFVLRRRILRRQMCRSSTNFLNSCLICYQEFRSQVNTNVPQMFQVNTNVSSQRNYISNLRNKS